MVRRPAGAGRGRDLTIGSAYLRAECGGSMPSFQAGGAGSIPAARSIEGRGALSEAAVQDQGGLQNLPCGVRPLGGLGAMV